MITDEVKILKEFAPNEEWKLTKTKEGKSKDSYVARSEKRKVFLKYDVDGSTLEILGNLSIAPKLLFAAKYDGRRYVIQEYIEGPHPKKEWVIKNLDRLGKFFHSFHYEEKIRTKLIRPNFRTTAEHVKEELKKRRRWILKDIDSNNQPEFLQKLDLLVETCGQMEKSSLVVVHADPNLTNFILDGERFYMIDWDDVLLSDEMKDISKFLAHSSVPENQWKVFFNSYGIEFNQSERFRFYWWLAFGELNIAYWCATSGYENKVSEHMNQFKEAFTHLKEYL